MESFTGLQVQVQSSHVDLFGHVNHARYLEFMEWGRFAWSAHHGFPITQMVEEGYGPAIIKAEIRWRRECRFGDVLRVTVKPVSARRGIGTLYQQIWRGEELVCDGNLSFVMFDIKRRQARELPEVFLNLLKDSPDSPPPDSAP
jgi:YbgC/YbaW family acyl-CoA thioester hydrolase